MARPRKGPCFGHPVLAAIPISRSLCLCGMLLGPHCNCSAGGTSWGCLSSWQRGSTWLQQGGSAHDQTTLCCVLCPLQPSPRARSITPCQETALGQKSMSREEAELHKCTLSIH